MKFHDSTYFRLTFFGQVMVPVLGGSGIMPPSKLGNRPNAASFRPKRKLVTGTKALLTPLNVPAGICQLLMFGYALRKSMYWYGSPDKPKPVRITVFSVARYAIPTRGRNRPGPTLV